MTIEEKRKMEILRNDNESLAKTIDSLKRQIGGYKSSNNALRAKNEELKKRVEHYKKLDLESDELYEGKIAECEELRKEYAKEIGMLTKQRDDALASIDFHNRKPWYKRLKKM